MAGIGCDLILNKRQSLFEEKKEDLYDVETIDTKEEKNFSFLSAHEIQKEKEVDLDCESEIKKKQKNNERIMNHIKAKKMQRSNLKKYKSNIIKNDENKKNCVNYCAECRVF